MKTILKIITVLGLMINMVPAQSSDRKWNVGMQAGFIQYAGDRGQSFYRFNQAAYGFAGISVSRYLTDHFDLMLLTTSGETGNMDVTGEEVRADERDNQASFLARQHSASLLLRYHFINPEHYVRPYVFAGPSVMYFEKRHTVNNNFWDFAIPTGGAGISFRINAIVGAELRETFMYSSNDDIDFSSGGLNDSFLYHTVGITFNLCRTLPVEEKRGGRGLLNR